MYRHTDSTTEQLWKKFKNKKYRDSFVATNVCSTIAAQIFSLREDRGWKQVELAEQTGMKQGRISLLEDPSYDKFTLSTLKRVASAFDVALVVRFVPFSELANWAANVSPPDLTPVGFASDSLYRGATRTFRTINADAWSAGSTHGLAHIFVSKNTPLIEIPNVLEKTANTIELPGSRTSQKSIQEFVHA